MDDDDRPRVRSDAAQALSRESLDPYSQGELDARIALLEAEIERVRSHRDRALAHRQAADAFFKAKPS